MDKRIRVVLYECLLFLSIVGTFLAISKTVEAIYYPFGEDYRRQSGVISPTTGIIHDSENGRRGLPPLGTAIIKTNDVDRTKIYLTDGRVKNRNGQYARWRGAESFKSWLDWKIVLQHAAQDGTGNLWSSNGPDTYSGNHSDIKKRSVLVIPEIAMYQGRSIRQVVDINQGPGPQSSGKKYDYLDIQRDGTLRFYRTESSFYPGGKDWFQVPDIWYEYEDNGESVEGVYFSTTLNFKGATQAFWQLEDNQYTHILRFKSEAVSYFLMPDTEKQKALNAEYDSGLTWNSVRFQPIKNRHQPLDQPTYDFSLLHDGSSKLSFAINPDSKPYITPSLEAAKVDVLLNDPNAFSPLPEGYLAPYVVDTGKENNDHNNIYYEADIIQPLNELGLNDDFYPIDGTFNMEVKYDHPLEELKASDFEYYISDGVGTPTPLNLLQGDIEDYISIDIKTPKYVSFELKQKLLFLPSSEPYGNLFLIKQKTKVPMDDELLPKYRTPSGQNGFEILTMVSHNYKDLLGEKYNSSTTTGYIRYQPLITKVDENKMYFTKPKTTSNNLNFVDMSADFESSYPGDEVLVSRRGSLVNFDTLGTNYNQNVSLQSKIFKVYKDDVVKVRVAESTTFNYTFERNDNIFGFYKFENRADLGTRFKQMMIETPDNVKLIEPKKANGEIDLPTNWTATDIGNRRSYRRSGTAALNNADIENYLKKVTFEVIDDDVPSLTEIKIYFGTSVRTNIIKDDPTAAVTSAYMPHPVRIRGKNIKGSVLYDDLITKHLILGEPIKDDTGSTYPMREIKHYQIPKEQKIYPDKKDIKIHDLVYREIPYTITYDLNGGQGATIKDETYSILDDSIMLNDGKGISNERFVLGGWVTKDGKHTFKPGQTIEARDYIGNMELLADWKPETVKATVNFLYQHTDANGKNLPIFEDFRKEAADRKRKESIVLDAEVNGSIEKLLEKSEIDLNVEGYVLQSGYKVMQGDKEIKDGKIPSSDFDIIYYYDSVSSISVPETLDFGEHSRKREGVKTRYSLASSHLNETIEVVDTQENHEWTLTSYASRLAKDNILLNSQLVLVDESNNNYIISDVSQQLMTKDTLYTKLPLKSLDDSKGLFLDIYSGIPEDGEYTTTLNLLLVNTP